MSGETDIFMLIANNGLAVVMLIWFMSRTEKVINNNTKAVNDVKIAVATCPRK